MIANNVWNSDKSVYLSVEHIACLRKTWHGASPIFASAIDVVVAAVRLLGDNTLPTKIGMS